MLEEKCKILSSFGKSNQVVAVETDQGLVQAEMDKKVSELVENELPKIQECYRLKATTILQEARSQVTELLRDHQLHQEKKTRKPSCEFTL